MKVLCVAEKPSIAKAVANNLSPRNINTRVYKNNIKNHDFKFDFGGQLGLCDVTMTHVFGHIYNCDFAPNYGWQQCTPDRLFELPTIELTEKKEVLLNIANEARNAQYLMIWTDCDREGEFIGYEILKLARISNRNFTLENTLRAQFSHTERNHIIHAAKTPVHLDKPTIDAVETRRDLDLRTGSTFTRLLTKAFKREFDLELNGNTKENRMISYGGCQFPTLGFVVDRYKRVMNFQPQEFWYIDVDLKVNDQKVGFNWLRNHLFDRLSAVLLYENSYILLKGKLRIIKVEEKPTRNFRPFPLTTVELQKCGSRYLKLSAKETLDTAEKLYNAGYLSYPRTETDKFPAAADLRALVAAQTDNNQWGSYASSLLNEGKFRQPRAGSHDDKAHPPIHPIRACDLNYLNQKEKKVYEFVTRHFLACCSEDAQGSLTNVGLKWGVEDFQTSGLTVLLKNYLDVYPYFTWKSSVTLPRFELNQEVTLNKLELKSGMTAPPSHMTETELIALMDLNGIGTDATMADHIEKIISREYITQQAKGPTKIFVPTLLGMSLVEGFNKIGFDNISLSKPFLRKNLELKLVDIIERRTTKNDVTHEVLEMYRAAYSITMRNMELLLTEYRHTKRQQAAA